MRRRLSLACALVHQPAVLFLDEPTVGIDPALRVQFWAYFRELAAAGTTLVVTSHVMDEADRCDELLFMLHGKLIARGSGAEIRRQAGIDDIEQAFLQLGPGRRGCAMNAPTHASRSPGASPSSSGATTERWRSLFVAPIVIMALLGWVIRDQKPPTSTVAVVNDAGPLGAASRGRRSAAPRPTAA